MRHGFRGGLCRRALCARVTVHLARGLWYPGAAMRVIGMMSGTSADGIDAALVRIEGAPPAITLQFEAHHHANFPAAVRKAILNIANGAATATEEISQLNFLLGEEFARAAIAACKKWRVPLAQIDLIGSHGQTIYHQGAASKFL